jgi:pantoate--beta-alanine ligase
VWVTIGATINDEDDRLSTLYLYRDLERDMTILQAEGCDLLFNPDPAEMYAPNFRTWVALDGIDQTLEGKSRPGHFRGVATVVSKLFNMVQPNSSYFGQKDAIQCVVIKYGHISWEQAMQSALLTTLFRKMAEDLNFPVEVKIVDTLREADGLAMSSRNTYLSKEERPIAPVLYHALKAGESQFLAGVLSRDGIINEFVSSNK